MTRLTLTASTAQERAAHVRRLLTWLDGFVAGRANADHHPASFYGLRKLADMIEDAKSDGGVIVLEIEADVLDALDSSFADVLCWFRGLRAGQPDYDEDRELMAAVDAMRRLRSDIERARA